MTTLAERIALRRRRREMRARWPRPKRFDCNLVVIGGGSGGLVAAYVAATLKAKVTLVEARALGGECLHTGCVPSKALLRSARAAAQWRDAEALGLRGTGAMTVDFAAVMERVQRVVAAIAPHDSAERFTALGVEVVMGTARIASPWSVEVTAADGARRTFTTRAIVVATGSRPALPPIDGLAEAGCLTSDSVWDLRRLPRRLVVLGGGPVGCELAQAFARLGSQVTLVEAAPRVLGREDDDVAAAVAAALAADGVALLAGHEALRCEGGEDGASRRLLVRGPDGGERGVAFDALLCAVGRRPNVEGLGLDALGIALTPSGTIAVERGLATPLHPHIHAVGDVAGPWQLTHAASHQAWHAALNSLLGGWWRVVPDTSAVPWTTFTDPEAARVGLSEAEARERGVAFEVTRYALADLDRAIVDGATRGFVKVLTVPGRDRILGAAIVGEHAGEMLAELVLAMRHGLGLDRILATVHAYPTLAEANRYAAAEWKQAHLPQRLLGWAERVHRWRRA